MGHCIAQKVQGCGCDTYKMLRNITTDTIFSIWEVARQHHSSKSFCHIIYFFMVTWWLNSKFAHTVSSCIYISFCVQLFIILRNYGACLNFVSNQNALFIFWDAPKIHHLEPYRSWFQRSVPHPPAQPTVGRGYPIPTPTPPLPPWWFRVFKALTPRSSCLWCLRAPLKVVFVVVPLKSHTVCLPVTLPNTDQF